MEKQELIQKAIECGCRYGKYGDKKNGYKMSQFPEDIAELIFHLQKYEPFENSLEIGIASGGTCRFIRENVNIKNTITVDNGKRETYQNWIENKQNLPGTITDIISSSIGLDIPTKKPFDLIGIDGDHSKEGIDNDWELALKYGKPKTLVWIHDINQAKAVIDKWKKIRNDYEVLFETTSFWGMGLCRL